ncbi:hypothetical protein IAT40_005909 [Kwoniella sp. CBS 6097]
MGIFDFLPCCGPRKDKVKDVESTAEAANLLPPAREESIISADGVGVGLTGGYGSTEQGLTDEQRLRIEAIGRQVGNHMLPIHSIPPAQRSSPSLSKHSHSQSHRALSPSQSRSRSTSVSAEGSIESSSRPSSPSPMRNRPDSSPAGMNLAADGTGNRDGRDEDDGVVRKTLFAGGGGGGGNGGGGRKVSSRGGRGGKRGKGRK